MKLKTINICLFFIIIGWNCNAKTFSTAEHPKSKGITESMTNTKESY